MMAFFVLKIELPLLWYCNILKFLIDLSACWAQKEAISPPLGEQDQSNASPQGQQKQSNPHPIPWLPNQREGVLPLQWIISSCSWTRVDVKPSLMFICRKLVGVAINKNVNIKLTLKLKMTNNNNNNNNNNNQLCLKSFWFYSQLSLSQL